MVSDEWLFGFFLHSITDRYAKGRRTYQKRRELEMCPEHSVQNVAIKCSAVLHADVLKSLLKPHAVVTMWCSCCGAPIKKNRESWELRRKHGDVSPNLCGVLKVKLCVGKMLVENLVAVKCHDDPHEFHAS